MKSSIRSNDLRHRANSIFVLAALIAFCACGDVMCVAADIIPPDRIVDWEPGVTVGVPGGIPTTRDHLIDVTQAPYHVDKTGVANARVEIQKAIDSAKKDDVIFLPEGMYRLEQALNIGKSGITLRGSGSKTKINCVGKGGFVFVGANSDYGWQWPKKGNAISAGISKGGTTLSIADTSAFSVGQMVRFTVGNDPKIPVVSVAGFENLTREMTRITGKTSTTLTIFPPLYGDYGKGELPARVNVAQRQVDFTGIEDMTVDASQTTAPVTCYFEQCYGCWLKNVRVRLSANYHVFFVDSVNCEVRHSYLDAINHTGSNGAGLLVNACSGCLFEDNIIYKAFPLIEVNHGSSGNVFAYNFCEDSAVFNAEGCAINSNHGPHNSFNLYEGNVSPNLQSDGYFGSASNDTLFRNWIHGHEPNATKPGWCISLNRFTRNYSLVGNLFGQPGETRASDGISLGNPNMGNGDSTGTAKPSAGAYWADWGKKPGPGGFQELDLDVRDTLLRKSNWNAKDAAIPDAESLGDLPLPSSLYLKSKPVWFGELSWPAFDPSHPTPTAESIPAGYRFKHDTDR